MDKKNCCTEKNICFGNEIMQYDIDSYWIKGTEPDCGCSDEETGTCG